MTDQPLRKPRSRDRTSAAVGIACLLAVAGPAGLPAQAAPRMGPEPPDARVAVLPAALYNAQANVQEPDDSAKAAIATAALRERLSALIGPQLVPVATIDSLAGSAEAAARAGGPFCNANVACAAWVAGRVHARWVVLAKVSKTSNLIWLLSAQLVRVESTDIVLDDSTELKGDPTVMVRLGARIFAERVARTVRRGGYTTNFPQDDT